MFDVRFDPAQRSNFYAACAYGLFVYLAAQATGQTAVQRLVSLPSVAAARRSLAINGMMSAAGCLVFFLVGSTLFAFYQQREPPGFPDLARQDHLLPHFVLTELAVPGLAGLLLAGLFAASMSSMDSGINSLAALVTCDWLPGRLPGVGGSRLLCALFGAGVVVAAALLVPRLGTNVFDIIIKIAGALFGPLLGVFLLGMLVPRANTGGAAVGLLAGAAALLVAVQTPLSHWWYGAVTSVPTFAVGALASLLFAPPPEHKVRGLVVVPWGGAAVPTRRPAAPWHDKEN
jgi:Na+/proline symporter